MRVLIVKMSSLGDLIHTLPALTDASRLIPSIEFDWVAEESFQDIPRLHPAVQTVIPIALRRWRQAWRLPLHRQQRQLFKERLVEKSYDYVIDAQGLIKSVWVSRMARGTRVGYSWRSARESLATIFYHRHVKASWQWHAIARNRTLFSKALGYRFDDNIDYGVRLDPSSNEPKNLVWCIHGTSRDDKCWPENRWRETIGCLERAGYRACLPWGNETEHHRAQRLAAGSNAIILPKLSLNELTDKMQQASGVIAVDTGLGHLSAALHRPTVSLYGPTDPALIGTIGQHQKHCAMNDCKPQSVVEALQFMMNEVASSNNE